ncbi:hypothetical protein [Streptomyces sp. AC627_RSS907]|uniref:hypothetical protein n=1 Tax=Streptomyces sp. AC627_RSS907 TaxID=2823684 RepID=UPI0035AEA2B4
MAKAASDAFTLAVADNSDAGGITINSVAPSVVLTRNSQPAPGACHRCAWSGTAPTWRACTFQDSADGRDVGLATASVHSRGR